MSVDHLLRLPKNLERLCIAEVVTSEAAATNDQSDWIHFALLPNRLGTLCCSYDSELKSTMEEALKHGTQLIESYMMDLAD